jgi:hypothetical protein
MDNYTEIKQLSIECVITKEEHWQENPPRIEECHGYHSFNEDEFLDEEITKVEIFIDENTIIDITSRLTKEEIKLLQKIE